ncbi:hypothetical protein ABPG72_014343 [Tetrahymena utriculariae]
MKNLSILILLYLSIQIFVCKNETFDKNQRILRELAESQDTCLYVLLDAGSSSTKVRVYKSVCRRTSQIPQLEALVPKDENGKDKYDDKIKAADGKNALTAVDLDETPYTNYFSLAFKIVNDIKTFYSLNTKPFLFLRATAGLRQLGTEQEREQILDLVRKVFRKSNYFHFLDDSWVKIITGEEEGLFLWLSVNYAYQKIKHQNTQQFDASDSIAVIDIGGASAQTAFYSTHNNKLLDLPEKTRIQIYSNTVLGYGNDRIIASVLDKADFASCFQKSSENITKNIKNSDKTDVNVAGNYNFVKCTNIMLELLNITGCTYQDDGSVKDCSGSSKLKKLTGMKNIVGASSVYFAKDELYTALNIKGDKFKVSEFRDRAKQYCSLDFTAQNLVNNKFAFTSCIQMMWVSTLLIDGLGLLNDEVIALKRYEAYNIDWSIGSLIYDINTMQCDYLDMNECTDKISIKDTNNASEAEQIKDFTNSLIINSFFSLAILLISNLLI